MSRKSTRKSRLLSLILRHKPETVGITLDAAGWVGIEELLHAMSAHGKGMSRSDLESVVAENDKQRFAISSDGIKIRAVQGHSVEVDLGLRKAVPPETLYHGTVGRFLDNIWRDGLKPMDRHHVHLSADRSTALKVGSRRGKAFVLEVKAADMAAAGHDFFLSENGVWLTDSVPPKYLVKMLPE